MKRRPSAALVISCVALFFSLASTALAACHRHFLATDTHTATYRFTCRLTNPVLHVYVNSNALLIADMLENRPFRYSAAFYGHQTVVRVVQTGDRYQIAAATVLRDPRIGIRLAAS